ncbi:hypothetical protein BSKO_01764 [Bryopsis sp. KO-2023]|nr:hypothetical protein BSKO_01764 [Bryopsis sp. KO-2023]
MDEKEELCDFEKECLATIEKNRKALRALGFSTPPRIPLGELRSDNKPKVRKRGCDVQVDPSACRRSKRLRGERVDGLPSDSGTRKPSLRRVTRSQTNYKRTDVDMYNYSLMRLQSMSETALATRINKLQRIDKVEAFIEVCKDYERTNLLKLAQQRLSEMLTGSSC